MTNLEALDEQAQNTAKTYQGQFAWFTTVFGVFVVIGYLITAVAVARGDMPLLYGAPLFAVLTYMAYTVLHDAVHGSICGKNQSLRWINECLGYAAGFIMMIPLTAHRHEHLTHHRNTNDPEGDPDFVVADMTRSPFHMLRALLGIMKSQYQVYLTQRWATAPRAQNVRFCLEIIAAFGLRILYLGMGFWQEGAVLILAGSIGGVLITMYLFAYIVHRPHNAVGRYVDTSTILAPKGLSSIVTWFWLFQNYHSIHHLFPRVPFYNYRKLFEAIEPIMEKRGAPIYHLTRSGLVSQG